MRVGTLSFNQITKMTCVPQLPQKTFVEFATHVVCRLLKGGLSTIFLNFPRYALRREAPFSPCPFNPLVTYMAPLTGIPSVVYTVKTEVLCSSVPLECLGLWIHCGHVSEAAHWELVPEDCQRIWAPSQILNTTGKTLGSSGDTIDQMTLSKLLES